MAAEESNLAALIIKDLKELHRRHTKTGCCVSCHMTNGYPTFWPCVTAEAVARYEVLLEHPDTEFFVAPRKFGRK